MNPAKALGESSDLAVSLDGAALIGQIRSVLEGAVEAAKGTRPGVTLSYAQSLDGCISATTGEATPISNDQSHELTHHLRAMHDAILVGVNTVIVDDPRLTVRGVEGLDPTPVVVDSTLRTPDNSRLLRGTNTQAIIATVKDACEQREARLVAAGAEVLRLSAGPDGRVDLAQLFEHLRRKGIRSVMVEGGAEVITSVLKERLADQLVVTVSPIVLGGVRSVCSMGDTDSARRPKLTNVHCHFAGSDMLVQGELERPTG